MEQKKIIHIHKIVFIIWAGFLISLLIFQHTDIVSAILERSGYVRLIEVCIFIGIVIEYKVISSITDRLTRFQTGVLVFAAALLIRILSLPFSEYLPTNDFANYYEGACYFAEHGFSGGMYEPLQAYGIPAFAGQAAVNGCLLRILSPTLLGMQILNCIYTAGICLMIYVLGEEAAASAGLAGACIYTFYPMGVLSVHITTNTHGAVFFMLLGMYFFIRAQERAGENMSIDKMPKTASVRKRVLETAACALCLVISNFYHPSVIIVLCGLAVYTAGCEIEKRIRMGQSYKEDTLSDFRHFRGRLVITAAVLILYGIMSKGIQTGVVSSGYMKMTVHYSYLSKIVYGLNDEYDGAWNTSDEDRISSYPPELQDKEMIRMIKERLKDDPYKAVRLAVRKTKLVWFGADNYDYFYMDGILKRYKSCEEEMTSKDVINALHRRQEEVCSILWNVSNANRLFIYCVWILAVIGIFTLLKKREEGNAVYLLLYIPLGWMAFIMISEMQSRYRYQGMTVIILMAGYGAAAIGKAVRVVGCCIRKV